MIFHRSLVREFSLIALAVVGVLMAIILTRLLISLLGKAAGGDVVPEAVVGLIAFGLLNYLPVLLGIGVFVAILLALTRSYRDSEMTVWFSTGLSIAAWIRPVLQFAFPVSMCWCRSRVTRSESSGWISFVQVWMSPPISSRV